MHVRHQVRNAACRRALAQSEDDLQLRGHPDLAGLRLRADKGAAVVQHLAFHLLRDLGRAVLARLGQGLWMQEKSQHPGRFAIPVDIVRERSAAIAELMGLPRWIRPSGAARPRVAGARPVTLSRDWPRNWQAASLQAMIRVSARSQTHIGLGWNAN
jgi:hypothetical protein